ncbi:MAG: thioredoxin [Clostridia bacterium]|nr:thioredoxin [Clostridia bacterium]
MKVTTENFEKEVLNSEVPVLVDFFATWCGPCKMMSPIVEELAKEMKGKAKVYKVDTDEEQNLALKYGIMSIPTFIVFRNGEPVGKAVGMRDKEELVKLLNS